MTRISAYFKLLELGHEYNRIDFPFIRETIRQRRIRKECEMLKQIYSL